MGQDEWLEKELKATEEENPAHLVILSHIPPYIEAPDEEDGYFNLESTTRQELVSKFKAKPGLTRRARVGLAGEGGKFFTPEMSGFRIVKMRQESIDHRFYCLSDMPASVD